MEEENKKVTGEEFVTMKKLNERTLFFVDKKYGKYTKKNIKQWEKLLKKDNVLI